MPFIPAMGTSNYSISSWSGYCFWYVKMRRNWQKYNRIHYHVSSYTSNLFFRPKMKQRWLNHYEILLLHAHRPRTLKSLLRGFQWRRFLKERNQRYALFKKSARCRGGIRKTGPKVNPFTLENALFRQLMVWRAYMLPEYWRLLLFYHKRVLSRQTEGSGLAQSAACLSVDSPILINCMLHTKWSTLKRNIPTPNFLKVSLRASVDRIFNRIDQPTLMICE